MEPKKPATYGLAECRVSARGRAASRLNGRKKGLHAGAAQAVSTEGDTQAVERQVQQRRRAVGKKQA